MRVQLVERNAARPEEILEQARVESIEAAKSDAVKQFQIRWQRYSPMFLDYLSGSTVREACRKHNYTQCNEFYGIMDRFHIPRIPDTRNAAKLAHKRYVNGLKDLETCKCLPCMWIRERTKRQ